jgi:glutamyl-Q tRNA(Asp) synthetase
MKSPGYIGRFAPSPTGPMHFGTLIAATGSYLQARASGGEWLLRIEDVDTIRAVPGMADHMLRTLEDFGFEWDREVVVQSRRGDIYADALQRLIADGLIFPCTCSRRQLADADAAVYPGTCRARTLPLREQHALRVRVPEETIVFEDAVMGAQPQKLASECGDFVLRRRDGLYAYQLAVVVDDALQGVTEVVRGADLLDSTARQIYLQRALGYTTPSYLHLPVAVDSHGAKLGKSTGAAMLDIEQPSAVMNRVLDFLGQHPPTVLATESLDNVWHWAIEHWDIHNIPHQQTIRHSAS